LIKISVVIPTYNNKRLLKNVLEALNDQLDIERGGYEVIVVDDGSNDNTGEEVADIPRTYPFHYVYLERSPDSCRARVRNEGWRRARGEFVAFLDSDMIVARSYMRELERYFAARPDMLVISYRYMLKEPIAFEDIQSGRVFQQNYRSLEYLEARHFDSQLHSFNLSALEHPWHCVYSCNMALPRARLEQLGGFDEGYKGWGMEDTDIGYRCYRLGMRIVSHLGIEALHQYHGEAYGDLRSVEKMIEWDQNITRMYRIHPSLSRELPRWRINAAYFTRRVPQMLMRKERNRTERVYIVREEADIPALQAEIEALSSQPGHLILVKDELESPSLHLWIQLLGYTPSEIRYFPRSYMFEPAEINRFLSKVFPWRKLFVLIYRCLRLLGNKLVRSVHRSNPLPAKK
jgi:glycosyltransferase involved in cell wall biosynthesis